MFHPEFLVVPEDTVLLPEHKEMVFAMFARLFFFHLFIRLFVHIFIIFRVEVIQHSFLLSEITDNHF